ncbi:hypothetical protein HMPREF9248_1203 [Fannyhessea vaginae PB189-T1-4]|uniref:Uncharacterized protein n=1 Tax=Fannyhessea vaginae PB189-T1-4 TaxID=866774 RepID=A0ABN0B1A8_9ACTN|nr:hypothetical protein HMPREF9248_1203 [Fannyhessea vaginae PB189-T1-4]
MVAGAAALAAAGMFELVEVLVLPGSGFGMGCLDKKYA